MGEEKQESRIGKVKWFDLTVNDATGVRDFLQEQP